MKRADAIALDRADPLARLRERFALPEGVLYFDGNSLGPLAVGVADRIRDVITHEWGNDLIHSWNTNNWMASPLRVGDRIARLIGANPGEVIVGDSTSVQLYKLLVAALRLRPDRSVIVTEAGNFPTDSYIVDSVAAQFGATIRRVRAGDLTSSLDEQVAVVCLTHINYRTGAMHDLAAMTAATQACGALMLWDLAHSAGAVPVDLAGEGVDLAVGCGYKFLNGGPGAPAFAFVATRWHAALDQPITGWLGHAAPFAMADGYEPAPGIARLTVGTPSILAVLALEAALEAFDDVALTEVRAKSVALSELMIDQVRGDARLAAFELASPADPERRGSQVCFAHDQAYPISRALSARGVVADYREPRILRFGITPLYMRFVDVFDAVEHLAQVVANDEWTDPTYAERAAVT